MTIKERIDEVTESRVFLHDAFFATALKYDGVLAEIIETITGRKLNVDRIEIQESIDNRPNHNVVLDSVCYEEDGTIWNVEIQNANEPDLMRRMRFYGDVLSARSFAPGLPYSDVPNVCVIFITSFDYVTLGRALYEPGRSLRARTPEEREENERMAELIDAKLDNGRYEYLINASVRDGSKISKLIEELTSQEPVNEGMFPRVDQMKEALFGTPDGEQIMNECLSAYDRKMIGLGIKQGIKQGIEQGIEQGERREQATMSALKERLLAEDKTDALLRAIDDLEYRNALLQFYFPNGVPGLKGE